MNAHHHTATPTLSVIDPRALSIRSVGYCRHPDSPEIDPRTTRQSFDAAGRLVESWDPRLWGTASKPNLTTVYGLSGQPLLMDSVDAGWQLSLPDQVGLPLSFWDARGSQRYTEFDEQQRLVTVTEQGAGERPRVVERLSYGDSAPAFAEHNQCGQLIRHDDPAGTQIFPVYGLAGAVLVEDRRFLADLEIPDWPLDIDDREACLEAQSFITRHIFNPIGELQEQTDAMGNVRTIGYDVAGKSSEVWLQLAGVGQSPQSLVHDIRYNAQDQVERETAGNGVLTHVEYAADDGRLIRLVAAVGNQKPLQDLNYVYDPVGNIVKLHDESQAVSHFNNQRIEPINRYRYDSLYQLVEAQGWEVSQPSHGPALPALLPTPLDPNQRRNYTQRFEYDRGGNLITRQHSDAPGFSMFTSTRSNRSLAQRDDGSLPGEPDIASSFDAGGNQQELQRGQAMLWDSRNQLSRVTLVKRETEPDDYECYRYDRPGHRLRKTGFTHSSGRTLRSEVRYLPGLEIHRQADGEEHHVISVEAGRSSVRALHWPEGAHNDQQRYSLSDHLGSSTLELDDEAGVLTQEHYYPFGGTACWAGKSALVAQYKTIRYSGKERDATGLYYYGYRYYAPWLQRWISSDPGGDIDGPNHYRFVSNNPLTRLDSYGACSTIPTDVVNAYDRMFKQGLVWSGLMHGSESGVETIMRVSKNNVAILDGEIESEQQRRLAERIASIPTSEYSITHFGSADFTTLDGVHFKSLVTLQNEKRDISYEGNSMGGNIPNFGNHDFAFFALEAGEKAGKTKSRFGAFRYHATLEKLGVKAGYTHIEVGDLLRPNTRDISEARARSLPWMEDLVTDEDGILNFKNRVGLRPDKEADLLFYGKDILKGLGLKIAVDLNSLNAATQETVVEWTANDRPLENLSEVINVFYRPQIAVPGGLKLQCGEFTLRPPPK